MRISARYTAGLFIYLLAIALPAAGASSRGIEAQEIMKGGAGTADQGNTVVYTLAMLETADWDTDRVRRAIRQVKAIFDQCGVTVTAGSVFRLITPERFRNLDESMQPVLLSALPGHRPAALLVNRTTDRDVAYSYLASAPVASRGTAWITRNTHPACLGTLLAHELGHILLNTRGHSADSENLMSYSCSFSNVARTHPGTRLTEAQCKKLRAR